MNISPKPQSIKSSAVALLNQYGELIHAHGYDLPIHSERAWERFESYPVEFQVQLMERFKKQLSIVLELNEQKTDFRDPIQSVWRIMQKFNWKPAHDLFQHLTKSDIIEIYMPDQTQLYRNMEYFKYTSYSLSELLFYPWYELFEHQAGFQEKLVEHLDSIFVGQSSEDYYDFSTPYLGTEKLSKNKLQVKLNCKALSPLRCRDTDINEAMIIVWNIDLVGKVHSALEVEKASGIDEKEITV